MNGSGPKILVVGCGGLGGIVAAHLHEVGADVTAITSNEAVAAAVNSAGYRLRGDGNPRTIPGQLHTALPEGAGPFDYIVLATQPPQVEAAARDAAAHLAPNGHFVCLQNGLCEPRVAAAVGHDRVIGAVVAWGGSMVEPGLFDRTAAGGFTLGRLAGAPGPEIATLRPLLESVGPVSATDNLLGVRWSKLALNSGISSLGTIGGERLGPLVQVRRYRRLALEIWTEAVAVANAERVRLEKVAGTLDLNWVALSNAERELAVGSPALFAKHALLLAVGLRYRRLRSSMLRAIERGRQPAVDFLNGEIIRHAEPHGIAVPVNRRVRELVRALGDGREQPGRPLLDQLYETTRS